MNAQAPALRRRLEDIVDEYDRKHDAVPALVERYGAMMQEIQVGGSVGGSYGGLSTYRRDEPTINEIRTSLLKSAWRHVYEGFNLSAILGPHEKKRVDAVLENPPIFALIQIRDVFGDYLLKPRYHILKGLAEIFGNLDPAYKSHEKVKIGANGLPKRVILTGFAQWEYSGEEQVVAIMNAVNALDAKPLVARVDVKAMRKLEKEDALEKYGYYLRTFDNGNGHLFFGSEALRSVNRALSEFYGAVLPDTPDEEAGNGKPKSTAVSKDLQYFPTPKAVVERLLQNVQRTAGIKILEPSCGCGRIMDEVKAFGADVLGYEVDPGRAEICRKKGHSVVIGNFLDQPPQPIYDYVLMNPPFYGKHYAKHVLHAMKFLKPGGCLYSVLPITARDHDLLPYDKRYPSSDWRDLPVGSFAESGTNINTTIYSYRAPWAQECAA